ncbi:hypothetical protein LIA77_10632 [Sarocladium implicatum]|nr:hypothetical protein LIA77_10632 [Sarocladium implicatum]
MLCLFCSSSQNSQGCDARWGRVLLVMGAPVPLRGFRFSRRHRWFTRLLRRQNRSRMALATMIICNFRNRAQPAWKLNLVPLLFYEPSIDLGASDEKASEALGDLLRKAQTINVRFEHAIGTTHKIRLRCCRAT